QKALKTKRTMKLLFFLSPGAPKTAVYKYVRCNPEGDQANCVTLQSPEMDPWRLVDTVGADPLIA
uniref:Uncharacterized protein n=1 Tax=Sparus aurata TaxID=8175 RepID=A0A671Y6I2_SPAAU